MKSIGLGQLHMVIITCFWLHFQKLFSKDLDDLVSINYKDIAYVTITSGQAPKFQKKIAIKSLYFFTNKLTSIIG